uniref:glycine--tRNA ligase n=1 Tax=Lactuca sativa TaxID=4236 RepID=A0A9R1VJT3_LACSA|nr:hypothetical protein LSAT_V11C500290420 [Lactuca sativa]
MLHQSKMYQTRLVINNNIHELASWILYIIRVGPFDLDRLDSLVWLFGAGCQPSSTNDPFGLRRISYGPSVTDLNCHMILKKKTLLKASIAY